MDSNSSITLTGLINKAGREVNVTDSINKKQFSKKIIRK